MAQSAVETERDERFFFGLWVAAGIVAAIPGRPLVSALVAVLGGCIIAVVVPERFHSIAGFPIIRDRVTQHPTFSRWFARLLPVGMVGFLWEYAQPWNASIRWAPLVACLIMSYRRGILEALRVIPRESHGMQGWTVNAVVVALTAFMFFGGPFRVRWAYCENRLTREAVRGVADRGPICWPDGGDFERGGVDVLHLVISSNQGGLTYSPDGLLADHEGTRELGDGWYATAGDDGWNAVSTDD